LRTDTRLDHRPPSIPDGRAWGAQRWVQGGQRTTDHPAITSHPHATTAVSWRGCSCGRWQRRRCGHGARHVPRAKRMRCLGAPQRPSTRRLISLVLLLLVKSCFTVHREKERRRPASRCAVSRSRFLAAGAPWHGAWRQRGGDIARRRQRRRLRRLRSRRSVAACTTAAWSLPAAAGFRYDLASNAPRRVRRACWRAIGVFPARRGRTMSPLSRPCCCRLWTLYASIWHPPQTWGSPLSLIKDTATVPKELHYCMLRGMRSSHMGRGAPRHSLRLSGDHTSAARLTGDRPGLLCPVQSTRVARTAFRSPAVTHAFPARPKSVVFGSRGVGDVCFLEGRVQIEARTHQIVALTSMSWWR
jgi:hypothetical protein